MASPEKKWKIDISILALIVSISSAMISYWSMRTNVDAQRAALFSQFQAQYNQVHARFPEEHRQPTYRPPPGTDEYARLEAYWFFCFSEWYATHRVNANAYRDLWDDYYTPLIADGLQIVPLRYVLENRVMSRSINRGDWAAFLVDLARIAQATGKPLSPQVERRLARFGLRVSNATRFQMEKRGG